METFEEYFPLFELPEEVREVIYNKLTKKDATDFRLISHQCRDDIDNLYNYAFRIPYGGRALLERIRELRVKSCTILIFFTTIHTPTIFKYPHLVQHLTIHPFKIIPQNFYRLLAECSENLQTLDISLKPNILQYNLETKQILNFKNLKSLKVVIKNGTEINIDHLDQEICMFNYIVKDSLKPNLKSLSATLTYQSQIPIRLKRFSSAILSTICIHSPTLKSIDFNHNGYPSPEMQDFLLLPSKFEENVIRKIKHLKKISLSNSCKTLALGLWENLCTNQVKLEKIQLSRSRFEWGIITQVASKNFQTLVSIYVTFTIDTVTEKNKFLDISTLRDCEVLKHLQIETEMDDNYFLQNLVHIPKSIELLIVLNFKILSEELSTCFDDGIFDRLRVIMLGESGESGVFGVNGTVLEKLAGLPKIRKVYVQNINFVGNTTETEKLLGIPKLHGNVHDGRYKEIAFLKQNSKDEKWDVCVDDDPLPEYIHV